MITIAKMKKGLYNMGIISIFVQIKNKGFEA